jgi:hypothetical protein
MGTAVEMWVGHQAGVPVWTVTPLTTNWAVFSLSTKIFSSLEELAAHLRSGALADFEPDRSIP